MAKVRKKKSAQVEMFQAGDDLPLFSGTAQRGTVEEFKPQPQNQPLLPGMPAVTLEDLQKIKDKLIKPKRK